MPPRLPLSARQLQKHVNKAEDAYVCLSCRRKGFEGQRREFQQRSIPPQGHNAPRIARLAPPFKTSDHIASRKPIRAIANSSLASRTAVNAPSTVPPAYRELYQRLLALQEIASSHVDLSRLQLALRSLESSSPVVRVALLGLGNNGASAARKLASALLSDPLSEEAAWEQKIVEGMSDGRNLLLRYGEAEGDAMGQAGQSPLLQTLQIPSPFLRQNNVEILVANVNTNRHASASDRAAFEDTVLVPTLTTPTSAGGRVGFVRYPVHKAVIVTEGVAGAVDVGRLPEQLLDSGIISTALSVPLRQADSPATGEQQATYNTVDIDLAIHGLALFRTNRGNGAKFSEEWQTSRLSHVADWIAGQKTEGSLSADIRNLVSSVLSDSMASASSAESAATSFATNSSVPDAKRASLQSAISAWSADGHKDLQSNLDPALSVSNAWRRTVWWRLFWRIDDVTTSTSDLLRQSWLTEANQRLSFLSGQIVEAGLANQEHMRNAETVPLLDLGRKNEMAELEQKPSTETIAQLMRMPSMLASMQQQSGVNALFNPPWPQTITLSRQYLINSAVPTLHTNAQSLLFTAVSTIAGSTAMGAWFYIATAGIALYESGAIAALGLVWALRRLQKNWGRERSVFANNVREDGRKVLGEVEESLRKIVREGGRATVRPDDVMAWRESRIALERCQEALDAIGRKT